MIQKSLHTKTSSPIKKQLAKRIITYFDQLENARSSERSSERRSGSRSVSPSKSRSKSKSYIEFTEPDKVVYDDVEVRRKKLEDLKNLMKKELLQAKTEGSTASVPEDIYKSVHGYPSFMKTQRTSEQYRRKPTTEADLNAFKKSVHKLLEDRVLKADGKDPKLDESYDYDTLLEETQKSIMIDPSKSVLKSTYNSKNNLFDENLYPLERDKTVLIQSPVDGKNFDFHQRKSKEIRRLQYGNGLRDRSISKDKPTKQMSEVPVNRAIDESKLVDEDKQTGRPRERRTHPDETQDVYVRFTDGKRVWTVPAYIRNVIGFKTNSDDSVEVREHDRVVLSNRKEFTSDELFADIQGTVDRFYPELYSLEKDCDLVVQTSDGNRHPVLFSLRQTELEPILENEPEPKTISPPEPVAPPKQIKPIRVMGDANCTAFDPEGKLLGRGKLALEPYDKVTGEQLSFGKGILLSEDNEKVEFVLVRFTPGNQCILKRQNLKNTSHKVESVEPVEIPGYKLKYVTLIENTARANPELLVLLDGQYQPQKDKLLSSEPATCELEDWRFFKGNLNYQQNQSDREGVLWLDLFPEEIEAAKTLVGTEVIPNWENSFKCPPLGNKGESLQRIRLEMDDIDPDTDISNLLDMIKTILQRSKVEKSVLIEPIVSEPDPVEVLSPVQSKPVQDSVRVSQIKDSAELPIVEPIQEHLIDVIVNGPNNQRLRIFLCPKGQIAQVEDIIADTYGPARSNPSPMSLQVGEEIFIPDGLRTERNNQNSFGVRGSYQSGHARSLPQYNEQQAARTLQRYDLRVVQFNVQPAQDDEETRKIREELENLKKSKDFFKHSRTGSEFVRQSEVLKSRDSLLNLSQIRAQEVAEARKLEEEAAQRARDAEEAAKRAKEAADAIKKEDDAKRVRAAMLEVKQRAEEAAQAAKREEDARRVRQSMLEAQRRAEEALQAKKNEDEAKKLRQSAEQSFQEIAKKSRKGSAFEMRGSQDLMEARKKEEQAIRASKDASQLAKSTADAAQLLKRQEEERRIQDAFAEKERKEREAQKALEEQSLQIRRSQLMQETVRQSMEAAERIKEEIKAHDERVLAERALHEALELEAAAKAEEDRLKEIEEEEAERQEADKKLQQALLDAQRRAEEAAEAQKREEEATKRAQEAIEAARKAEEAAEAAKKQEEAMLIENTRLAEEARLAEDSRLAEEAKLAEEAALKARIEDQNRIAVEAAHLAKKEEEIRKIREADELARRQAAETQIKDEAEAKRRQQEEIEQTQKKVQELKQALEKSKLSQAESGPKIFKGPSEHKGPSRYENEGDSVDEKSQFSKNSKKPEPNIFKSDLAESKARIVPGSTISKRTSGSIIAQPPASNLNKNKNLSQSMAPGKIAPTPIERKSETLHYTTQGRKDVRQSASKDPATSSAAQNKEQDAQESTNHYTKIELNLENSYDDIDFIGYGTMKVSTKKDGTSKSRQGSPDMKYKFTKISPAKNLEETLLPKDHKLNSTKAFTPYSNQKQKGLFSSSKKSFKESQGQRTPGNNASVDIYDAAATAIQQRYRFGVFRTRLRGSQDYHSYLASHYSQQDLFAKYLIFVQSLPTPVYNKKSFTIFINNIVGFHKD